MIVRVNVVLNRTVVVYRVLMLERSSSHSYQRNATQRNATQRNATLCCAKNRHCESSITLKPEKGIPFGRSLPV